MKVRPTGYHSTHIDVEEESPSYYITRDGELLSKKGYEPVPEERWVDVTAECEFTERWPSDKYSEVGAVCKDGLVLWEPTYHTNGYRFRKVTHGSRAYFLIDKKQ